MSSPYGVLLYKVTSVDVAADWLFALAVDPGTLPYGSDTTLTHTYASAGTKTAFIQTCCRLSGPAGGPGVGGHVNNPDRNYRIQTVMNVGATPPNTGPVSTLPPIVDCPYPALCTFSVPAADANSDVITWRLATATEAAGSGNSFFQPGQNDRPTNATIDSATGVYNWNTTNALAVYRLRLHDVLLDAGDHRGSRQYPGCVATPTTCVAQEFDSGRLAHSACAGGRQQSARLRAPADTDVRFDDQRPGRRCARRSR